MGLLTESLAQWKPHVAGCGRLHDAMNHDISEARFAWWVSWAQRNALGLHIMRFVEGRCEGEDKGKVMVLAA